jgi:hypothetical protein
VSDGPAVPHDAEAVVSGRENRGTDPPPTPEAETETFGLEVPAADRAARIRLSRDPDEVPVHLTDRVRGDPPPQR